MKYIFLMTALMAAAGSSAAATAQTAIDPCDRPVIVIVDGQRHVINRRDVSCEAGTLVVRVPPAADRTYASHGSPIRGEAAPTLVSRNRSPSPR